MVIFEIIKAAILGIIQGITEWLPVSSTGHMILFDSFWPMDPSQYSGGQDFINLFLVVIQFGSILAVLTLYFHKLNPFSPHKSTIEKKETFSLWGKVLVGVVPAGVIGLLFDDLINQYCYNAIVISVMLILYGIFFLILESRKYKPTISSFEDLSYKTALLIGVFQVLALIPGTSRSGATILGAVLIGTSRYIAAEFSFFLAIPTMLGASLLKILEYFIDYGFGFTGVEFAVLLTGMVVAFLVSLFAIAFLMKFIQKHDFKPFGYYRIALGILVLILLSVGVLNVTTQF